MFDPVDPLSLYPSRRRLALRASFWALVLIPPLSTMLTYAVEFLTRWSLDYSIGSLLGLVLTSAHGALMGVCVVQILIWWQWKPHHGPRWPLGLSLLAALEISSLVVSRLSSLNYGEGLDFWPMTALSAAMSLSSVAIHSLVLAGIGAFVRYWFVDRSVTADEESDGEGLSARRPWTIRGMFVATLVAALTLTCMRWSRALYDEAGSYWYPTSDAGYAAWFMTSAFANLCAALAAAHRRVGGARIFAWLLVVVSIGSAWLGLTIWAYFLPESQGVLNYRNYVGIVADSVWMYLFHLWVFKRWQRCGYDLRRAVGIGRYRTGNGDNGGTPPGVRDTESTSVAPESGPSTLTSHPTPNR